MSAQPTGMISSLSAASGSISVGGTITADTLTITAGDDLELTTHVDHLNFILSGSDSDLTVHQTGDLIIDAGSLAGGDHYHRC